MLERIDAMVKAAEKAEIAKLTSEAMRQGKWTTVEQEIPPVNQVVRVIYEHYTDDKKLDMTSVHLALGKDENSVQMVKLQHINKHRFHKVAMWQPVDLLDKTTMLEVAKFLTEMAEGD